jgi:MarR family protein
VATADDYAAVYELVADLFSAGVEASVPATVRETVEAVRQLKKSPAWTGGVPQREVVKRLGLDKGTVSRRISQAIALGYLVNEEERHGRPSKLVLGDPLPAEVDVLPRPELFAGDGCSVAAFSGERGGFGTVAIRCGCRLHRARSLF